MNRTSLQRGTSLIEILVVLVILVLGILTVVRLFPAGFLAVRAAENSTLADRLGEGTLEDLKQSGTSLPDGIYVSYIDANGLLRFNPNVTPDDLSAYPGGTAIGNANAADDPYSSDLNKARYISNETFPIPAAHIVTDPTSNISIQLPPIHPLGFGPIFLDPTIDLTALPGTANAARNATYFNVVSAPWTAKTGDSRLAGLAQTTGPNYSGVSGNNFVDNPLDELAANTPNYLIDAGAGEIAVPPADYRQYFTLTVQVSQNGALPQTYTVSLTLPPSDGVVNPDGSHNPDTQTNYNGGWFSLAQTNNPVSTYVTRSVISSDDPPTLSPIPVPVGAATPGGIPPVAWVLVTLARPFQCVNNANTGSGVAYDPAAGYSFPFSTDPYEYAVCNPNFAAASGTTTSANIGVLAFNPLAAGQGNIPALKAQVSYTTFDWHIIHEDRALQSSDQDQTIRLTLGYLKKVGDFNPDQSLYSGLFPNGDGNNAYDLLALNEETGQLLPTQHAQLSDVQAGTTGSVANPISVNYEAGQLTFPSLYSSVHVRLFYQGDANWAVAVQKAPSLYTRNLLFLSSDHQNRLTDPKRLQVAQYAFGPVTGSGTASAQVTLYFPACDESKMVELDDVRYPVSYQGGTTAIEKKSTDTETISDGKLAGSNVASVTLNLPFYDQNSTLTNPNGVITIGAVRGISAKAVVIFKQNTQFQTRSVDTLLTSGTNPGT